MYCIFPARSATVVTVVDNGVEADDLSDFCGQFFLNQSLTLRTNTSTNIGVCDLPNSLGLETYTR